MSQVAARTLVAGVDSSTQSCKVVVRDAATGELVRSGRATHPGGTEVDPEAWWDALSLALAEAGGLDDVAALSVAAQQHGMVCLDAEGTVVRPALLWNDTRSAAAAADLVAELGPDEWVRRTGSVPVASFTVTKLRWLVENEPAAAARTVAVALPHDWLTWRLAGAIELARGASASEPRSLRAVRGGIELARGASASEPRSLRAVRGGIELAGASASEPRSLRAVRGGLDLTALTTDRSDASGTGYWSPGENAYRPDLLTTAFGRVPVLPTVLGPCAQAGRPLEGRRSGRARETTPPPRSAWARSRVT